MIERAARALIYAAIAFGLVTWNDMQVQAALLVVAVVVYPLVEFIGGLLLRHVVTSDKTLDRSGLMRDGKYIAEKPLISTKEWETRAGKQ